MTVDDEQLESQDHRETSDSGANTPSSSPVDRFPAPLTPSPN